MKRFKLFFAVAAIIGGMASCNSDDIPEPVQQESENYSDLTPTEIRNISGEMKTDKMFAIDGTPIIPEGAVFIYQTEEGRYGKMQVIDYDFGDNHKMTFKYVTYKLDNSGDIHSANPSATVRGTWLYDLDDGVEESVGAEFWWERETATETSFTPRNGAIFSRIYFNN